MKLDEKKKSILRLTDIDRKVIDMHLEDVLEFVLKPTLNDTSYDEQSIKMQ